MALMMAACVASESFRTIMFSGGNSNFPIRTCRISSMSLSDPASSEILSDLYLLMPTRRAHLAGAWGGAPKDPGGDKAAAVSGGVTWPESFSDTRPVSLLQKKRDRTTSNNNKLSFVFIIGHSYS